MHFEIHLDVPSDRDLVFRSKSPDELTAGIEPTVTLRVNGREIGRQRIRSSWHQHRFTIAGADLRPGTNRLELLFSHVIPAAQRDDGGVEIAKAARIADLGLVVPDGTLDDDARPVLTDTWDSHRFLHTFDRPGVFVLSIAVPQDAVQASIELRASQNRRAPDAELRLEVCGIGAAVARSSTVRVPPGRSLTVLHIPVEELAGGWAMISIEHDRDDLSLTLSPPRFEQSTFVATSTSRLDSARRPPDIVWITIDAARADHFGFAGYHRDTSPFIDSLARESLVFANTDALAPYDPPPEHDRYTDPAYDGPCDGWPRTLFNVNNGIVDASPACLDHFAALYDGNVNVADAAVRTIVEALRARSRWRNTVVLVTSDHGEAFFEHGRLGHNATVYGEMLHVPFVLRLPASFDTDDVDTEGLATVADILPTLVAAAGLDAPPLIDGVNLLDSRIHRENRFIIHRNSSRSPVFGLRSLH